MKTALEFPMIADKLKEMVTPHRIALLMSQDAGFHRQVLLGVRAYADHEKQWMMHNASPTQGVLKPLTEWNPHGIIACLDNADIARSLLKLGKPIIDTGCILKGLRVPTIEVDHAAIARLATEHFVARGYQNFGYLGSRKANYSRWRLASFRESLLEAGHDLTPCHIEYHPHLSEKASWKNVNTKVRQWLGKLAKPAAVLADHDLAAFDLANMCQILGLHVPNDVAILGVDNDELVCKLAFPPLSSVAIPAEQIGFEAAKLLDRIMAGEKISHETIFIPPVRVVTRHSTSIFAIDEPIVTGALHYIRNNLAAPLRVGDIADKLVVSRRVLEQKFRSLLGRSLLDEIHRVRVEHAKELLATTELLISEVAKQSGFSTPQRMATVFRKLVGDSPGDYRRQVQVRLPKKRSVAVSSVVR